jgi:peptidyl-prolyl cis-trans isomerase D
MSVIQKIRDKYAALAIAVIAIAMVGFILIDALSSRTGGGMFNKNSTTVGKVNGEKIELPEFDNQLKRAEQNYQSRGMQVSEEMREEINNQLWNTLVGQKVVDNQIAKLGLAFTGKELDEVLYGQNPPDALKEKFTDPKTGQYNAAAVAQMIKALRRKPTNDPERLGLEDYIDNEVVKKALLNKYIIMLMGSSYYPKWLSEKDNQDNSSVASVSYVSVPYTAVPDANVSVSDEEIGNYIRAHEAEYTAKEASRNINYVSFNAEPSSRDSAAALAQITSLRQGFAETKDAAGFLNQNGTATALFDGYISKSSLMIPQKDSIMSLPADGVFGPYIDRNASGTSGNYVIAKMLDKRDLPDSVKCRHILISTRNGAIPDSVAKQRIDSIVAVIQKGGDFKVLAAQLSEDEGSKDKGGEYTFAYNQAYSMTGQGGLLKPFADFIFYGKTGDKKVVKTDAGYHYIEILNQENIQPYYKVAYLSKEILPSEETVNTANAAATRFAADAQGGGPFEEIARKYKMPVLSATVKDVDFQVEGIGSARRLVKWSFDNKLGTVGDPENFGNKYIVARVSGEQEAGLPTGATARTLVENQVRKDKKAREIIGKLGSPTDLNAAAAKYNVTVQRVDSVSFVSPYVQSLGSEPRFVGASFNKVNLNKVSAPFQGTSGVFAIRTESVTSIPNQNNDYSLLRQNMEGMMRENIGRYSQQGLFESADVKDYRIKFY